jgi:hypothetical protein
VVRPCLTPVRRAHLREHCDNSPRARRIGFSHRAGAFYSTWLRPFALPRPDALSPFQAALPAAAHNTRRYEHPLFGGRGPIGTGLC